MQEVFRSSPAQQKIIIIIKSVKAEHRTGHWYNTGCMAAMLLRDGSGLCNKAWFFFYTFIVNNFSHLDWAVISKVHSHTLKCCFHQAGRLWSQLIWSVDRKPHSITGCHLDQTLGLVSKASTEGKQSTCQGRLCRVSHLESPPKLSSKPAWLFSTAFSWKDVMIF